MLRGLFSRLRKRGGGSSSAPSFPVSLDASDEGPILVRYNTDGLQDDERMALNTKAAEAARMPVFEGHVEHAYDMALVADPSKCPRCGSPTEQYCASFIYATQIAPRVMFAPAGFFCTRCPTVTIIQELIETGISDSRFQYQGVLGIDYGKGRDPGFFTTWNGEDAVYLFDEDENPIGIGSLNSKMRGHHASPAQAKNKQRKERKREKAARRARRVNRRK